MTYRKPLASVALVIFALGACIVETSPPNADSLVDTDHPVDEPPQASDNPCGDGEDTFKAVLEAVGDRLQALARAILKLLEGRPFAAQEQLTAAGISLELAGTTIMTLQLLLDDGVLEACFLHVTGKTVTEAAALPGATEDATSTGTVAFD